MDSSPTLNGLLGPICTTTAHSLLVTRHSSLATRVEGDQRLEPTRNRDLLTDILTIFILISYLSPCGARQGNLRFLIDSTVRFISPLLQKERKIKLETPPKTWMTEKKEKLEMRVKDAEGSHATVEDE